jgi:hypothetical protein
MLTTRTTGSTNQETKTRGNGRPHAVAGSTTPPTSFALDALPPALADYIQDLSELSVRSRAVCRTAARNWMRCW